MWGPGTPGAKPKEDGMPESLRQRDCAGAATNDAVIADRLANRGNGRAGTIQVSEVENPRGRLLRGSRLHGALRRGPAA